MTKMKSEKRRARRKAAASSGAAHRRAAPSDPRGRAPRPTDPRSGFDRLSMSLVSISEARENLRGIQSGLGSCGGEWERVVEGLFQSTSFQAGQGGWSWESVSGIVGFAPAMISASVLL